MRAIYRSGTLAAVAVVLAAGPVWAQTVDPQLMLVAPEARLTPVRVFLDASPVVKAIMAALAAGAVAAAVLWARQLGRGPDPRALAFYGGLHAAGPLLGLLGAVYGLLNSFLGISNVRPTPSLSVVAPGIAEALPCFGLGLFAAVVAVMCRWHIKAQVEIAAHALKAH